MSPPSPTRRSFALGLLLFGVLSACASGGDAPRSNQEPPAPPARPVVAITQIATHPALDEVREGLIAGLAKRGLHDGQEIDVVFQNANGDGMLTTSIAEEFARRKPAVIVPISTPSALAVVKAAGTVPVVFSGVTDPVKEKIVSDLQHPGGTVTGVSDRWPFEAQVQAFRRYFPNARRIGMIYKKGDDVSKVGVDEMTRLAPLLGFELILRPVSSDQEIYDTATALFREADAVYTGIDHLVLGNMDGLVKAATEANKPLFGGESGSVEKGAVLALSIDMTQFGDITAGLVTQVLNGTRAGDIPVAVVSEGVLMVNPGQAKHFGLDVAAMVATGARTVGAP